MMSQEADNIELRSQEIQDILGKIPHWIIRVGIGIIFTVILMLFIGSNFFKYPTKIAAPIIIMSQNSPVHLKAKVDGKIAQLFVSDNQYVNKSQILAVIESNANYENVILLKTILDSVQGHINNLDTSFIVKLQDDLKLGNIQPYYSEFAKSCKEDINFRTLNYHHLKIESLKKQLQLTREKINASERQMDILEEELESVSHLCSKDSSLFYQNIIELPELIKSKDAYLSKMYSYEELKSSVLRDKIELNKLSQDSLDFTVQWQNEKSRLKINLRLSYKQLKGQIDSWMDTNLLISPIEGKISFTIIDLLYQDIKVGDVVFIIAKGKLCPIIGKLELPISKSGKVKIGQAVNIKLDNYPYMKYGILKGKIKSIASIPIEENYMVIVNIPQELVTNYGKSLKFSYSLKGTAEIITETPSILQKLLQPLKSI